MEDHDSADGTPAGLPSGVTGIAIRIVLRAIESSGHPELARKIREAPDTIGDKIGAVVGRLFGKVDRGEVLTNDDVKSLERVLRENPKEATQLLGTAVSVAFASGSGAGEETNRILASYESTFNTVCDVMAHAGTSLALRGFIHGNDCVSYWKLTGKQPRFKTLGDYLYPSNVEVYLLWAHDPTPSALEQLNDVIRRGSPRRLPSSEHNVESDDAVGLVQQVHELSFRVRRLHPERAALMQTESRLFDEGPSRYDRPVDIEYVIPNGAPALVELFDSLFEALAVQRRHSQLLNETDSAIAKRKSDLSHLDVSTKAKQE